MDALKDAFFQAMKKRLKSLLYLENVSTYIFDEILETRYNRRSFSAGQAY